MPLLNFYFIKEQEYDFDVERTDLSNGAIIKLNETSYVKIIKDKMIFYLYKNKRWVKTRPILIKKTKFKFPSDINASFESINVMYFFIRKDKYCRRRINDNNEVSYLMYCLFVLQHIWLNAV